MNNRYFKTPWLSALLDIQSWRLVSAASADYRPCQLPRHNRWMPLHQHTHPYREVMIALEGKTVYGLDRRLYPCAPGSVFVFDPGVPHDSGYPAWAPSTTHLWIAFIQNKAMAKLIDGRGGHNRILVNIPELFDLHHAALWQPGAVMDQTANGPPELARLGLLASLADLVASLVAAGYAEAAGEQRCHNQLEKIEIICRLIRETGGRDAGLNHLAQVAGYSKYHFLRLFQAHTGCSVHAFVNQARLHKAQECLARGQPHKAIAAELGFSCPAAFSRWYRPFRSLAHSPVRDR